MKHIINKRIGNSTYSLCIHICLSKQFHGNKYEKYYTYFSKKIIKNIKADRQLGILCFSIGKKAYVLPLGMPHFIGSNYIRKKRSVHIGNG